VRRANNHGLSPRDVSRAVSGYKSLIAEEKLFHDHTFGIASRLNATESLRTAKPWDVALHCFTEDSSWESPPR
jgi:hypothetical protein